MCFLFNGKAQWPLTNKLIIKKHNWLQLPAERYFRITSVSGRQVDLLLCNISVHLYPLILAFLQGGAN